MSVQSLNQLLSFYSWVHPLLSLRAPMSHHDSQGHSADTTVLLAFLPGGLKALSQPAKKRKKEAVNTWWTSRRVTEYLSIMIMG